MLNCLLLCTMTAVITHLLASLGVATAATATGAVTGAAVERKDLTNARRLALMSAWRLGLVSNSVHPQCKAHADTDAMQPIP